ncbi:hypothetical protein H311_02032 [Anncaliia algerae PRA109]|nr:hypothetical protein H311_02032 [Anncaliia algerae PRA109]
MNTSISLKKKMNYLQDLECQDVEEWVDQYRTLMQESKWNNETSLAVLKSIINNNIMNKIKEYTSIDTILDALVRLKYPPDQINFIYLNIKNIQQNNYLLIKEYYNELEKAVKTMAYVNKMSQKEQKYKTEELFFQNLESETRLELIKQQLTTTEKAIEYISAIENTLISIEQNELVNKHPNISKPNHPEYNALNYTKNSEEVRKKYCPYHKSRFHYKSECNKMKAKTTTILINQRMTLLILLKNRLTTQAL